MQFVTLAIFVGHFTPIPQLHLILLGVACLFSRNLVLTYIALDSLYSLRIYSGLQSTAVVLTELKNLPFVKIADWEVVLFNPTFVTIFTYVFVVGESIVIPWFIARVLRRIIAKYDPSIRARLLN